MSIETNTPNIRTPEQPMQPDDQFDVITEIQNNQDAALAARRLVAEQADDQSRVLEATKAPKEAIVNGVKTGVGLTLAAGAALGIGHLGGEALDAQMDHLEQIGQKASQEAQQSEDQLEFGRQLDSGTVSINQAPETVTELPSPIQRDSVGNIQLPTLPSPDQQ